MEVSFEIIEDFCTNRLRAYTVYLGYDESSEFEKFQDKDERFAEKHESELDEIYVIIEKMQRTGAKSYYFVAEKYCHYLPKVGNEIKDNNKEDYGIRLYCLYLRDDLIVFLNGDIKTKRNPQECPNVSDHYNNAEAIGRKLDKAIIDREINYDEDNPFDNFTLTI